MSTLIQLTIRNAWLERTQKDKHSFMSCAAWTEGGCQDRVFVAST